MFTAVFHAQRGAFKYRAVHALVSLALAWAFAWSVWDFAKFEIGDQLSIDLEE